MARTFSALTLVMALALGSATAILPAQAEESPSASAAGKGRLVVQVVAPKGVPATVLIGGRDEVSVAKSPEQQKVRTTLRLKAGNYHLAAPDVLHEGRYYRARPDDRRVTVQPGDTTTVSVKYSPLKIADRLSVVAVKSTSVALKWRRPPGVKVTLRRTTGERPARRPNQGTGVSGDSTHARDTRVKPGRTYSYALFTKTNSGWEKPLAQTVRVSGGSSTEATYVASPTTTFLDSGDTNEQASVANGVVSVHLGKQSPAPLLGAAFVLAQSTRCRAATWARCPPSPATVGRSPWRRPDSRTPSTTTTSTPTWRRCLRRAHPHQRPGRREDRHRAVPARQGRTGTSEQGAAILSGAVASPSRSGSSPSSSPAATSARGPQEVVRADRSLARHVGQAHPGHDDGRRDRAGDLVRPALQAGDDDDHDLARSHLDAVLAGRRDRRRRQGHGANIGLSVTGGFWTKAEFGLEKNSLAGGIIKEVHPSTPTVTYAIGVTASLGGELTVGPGVGTADAGVIAGVGGRFIPLQLGLQGVFTNPDWRANKCLKASAGLEAQLDLNARAWLGNWSVSKSLTLDALHAQHNYGEWYWPTNCEKAPGQPDDPGDTVTGGGVDTCPPRPSACPTSQGTCRDSCPARTPGCSAPDTSRTR